jgi:hypothetical protein
MQVSRPAKVMEHFPLEVRRQDHFPLEVRRQDPSGPAGMQGSVRMLSLQMSRVFSYQVGWLCSAWEGRGASCPRELSR